MAHNGSWFLRKVLVIDGAISGTSGLLMLLAGSMLERLLGVPAAFLQYAGVSLIPFAAFLFYLSQRDAISRAAVWTVIALNLVWVIGSVLVLFLDFISPSRLGFAFIALQAVAVAAFAEMQYVGLRKAYAFSPE